VRKNVDISLRRKIGIYFGGEGQNGVRALQGYDLWDGRGELWGGMGYCNKKIFKKGKPSQIPYKKCLLE
jgi:hypothetical protein